jgi:hypothetical protein
MHRKSKRAPAEQRRVAQKNECLIDLPLQGAMFVMVIYPTRCVGLKLFGLSARMAAVLRPFGVVSRLRRFNAKVTIGNKTILSF